MIDSEKLYSMILNLILENSEYVVTIVSDKKLDIKSLY